MKTAWSFAFLGLSLILMADVEAGIVPDQGGFSRERNSYKEGVKKFRQGSTERIAASQVRFTSVTPGTPIDTNTTLILTASASGGPTGIRHYQFVAYNTTTGGATSSPWSTENQWSLRPETAGTYRFRVYTKLADPIGRDIANTQVQADYATEYTVAQAPVVPGPDFTTMMLPTFRHNRCINCHGMTSKNENYRRHVEIGRFSSQSDSRIETFLGTSTNCSNSSCHMPADTPPNWRAPNRNHNWTVNESSQVICDRIKRNKNITTNGSLTEEMKNRMKDHLKDDDLIQWAVTSGFTNATDLGEAPPGNQADWDALVNAWVNGGMNCN